MHFFIKPAIDGLKFMENDELDTTNNNLDFDFNFASKYEEGILQDRFTFNIKDVLSFVPLDEEEPLVSAKDIPRPQTMVDAAPKGNVGDIKVFLAGERVGGPSLEEIERTNSNNDTDMRTPLMAVILGILQHKGKAMTLEDLAAEVARYWNRTFPTSPYSPEEFLFVMVRNSDHVRFTR